MNISREVEAGELPKMLLSSLVVCLRRILRSRESAEMESFALNRDASGPLPPIQEHTLVPGRVVFGDSSISQVLSSIRLAEIISAAIQRIPARVVNLISRRNSQDELVQVLTTPTVVPHRIPIVANFVGMPIVFSDTFGVNGVDQCNFPLRQRDKRDRVVFRVRCQFPRGICTDNGAEAASGFVADKGFTASLADKLAASSITLGVRHFLTSRIGPGIRHDRGVPAPPVISLCNFTTIIGWKGWVTS